MGKWCVWGSQSAVKVVVCALIGLVFSGSQMAQADTITGPTSIDTTTVVGEYTKIAFEDDGTGTDRLLVIYFDQTNGLKFWFDNGGGGSGAGDFAVQSAEIQTVDAGSTTGSPLGFVTHSGRFSIAYYDSAGDELQLWHDDGSGGGTVGDEIPQSGEITVLDSDSSTGQYASITTVANEMVVSYYDVSGGNLMMWYDDGYGNGSAGNEAAESGELRTIDGTANVGKYSAVTIYGGYITIAYYDETNGNLKLWRDDGIGGGTPGDGLANGGELRTIATTDDVGQYLSMTTFDSYLAISFYDATNGDLYMWYDDGRGGGTAGNGQADGTEVRTIYSGSDDIGKYSSIAEVNDRLAISCFDDTNDDLVIWHDDGLDGGTADDTLATTGEIRTIVSTGAVGLHTSALAQDDALFVSYFDQTNGDAEYVKVEFSAEPRVPADETREDCTGGGDVDTDLTPTFSFTLADPDDGDQVKFEITIDDSIDFSSPVIQYQSAALDQGSASFTVGQAVGGGTYVQGAENDKLVVGTTYYWRVRASEGSFAVAAETSDYTSSANFDVVQPKVYFEQATYSQAEKFSPVRLTVYLEFASCETVEVDVDTSNVLAIAGDDYTAVSIHPLTFEPGERSQSVDIALATDYIDELAETFKVTLSSPTNAVLGTITQTTVTIVDSDVPGINITESNGMTTASEDGASDTYVITLKTIPTADVVVSVVPELQLKVNGLQAGQTSTLTFTPANWNVPQTVTVHAINDDNVEGVHRPTISHTAASSDPKYDGLTLDTVTVIVTDNDEPDPEPDPGPSDPILYLQMSAPTASYYIDTDFTLRVTASNIGFGDAANIVVDIEVDSDVTIGTTTLTSGSATLTVTTTATGYRVAFSALAEGETVKFQTTMSSSLGGEYRFDATMDCDETDEVDACSPRFVTVVDPSDNDGAGGDDNPNDNNNGNGGDVIPACLPTTLTIFFGLAFGIIATRRRA